MNLDEIIKTIQHRQEALARAKVIIRTEEAALAEALRALRHVPVAGKIPSENGTVPRVTGAKLGTQVARAVAEVKDRRGRPRKRGTATSRSLRVQQIATILRREGPLSASAIWEKMHQEYDFQGGTGQPKSQQSGRIIAIIRDGGPVFLKTIDHRYMLAAETTTETTETTEGHENTE